LILLHFGNPKLHNKLLASRHPTWDDVQTFRLAKQNLIGPKLEAISIYWQRSFEVSSAVSH
jgi:hypothetical protein